MGEKGWGSSQYGCGAALEHYTVFHIDGDGRVARVCSAEGASPEQAINGFMERTCAYSGKYALLAMNGRGRVFELYVPPTKSEWRWSS